MTEPEDGNAPEADVWGLADDPWAGMVDELGTPFDAESSAGAAAEAAAEAVQAGAKEVPLLNLPEEFWGSREIFKLIKQQARADGTSPDAVLVAVLARASGMVSPQLNFDSGTIGQLNLFGNIIAPSGIGKTQAMRSAQRLILPASYLTDMHGEVDAEKFRDGWSLGSGEGMVEIFQGMVEKDTGEVYTVGKNKGEPKTKSVKAQVRENAFLFLDEGEALVKMMKERKGATVGQAIRTMWTGMGTGAANASETTTRHLADGSYSLGLLIGWQPGPAQVLLSEVGGGTPQRFIYASGIDPEMPEDPDVRPDPVRLPLCDGHGHPRTGTIQFPREIKRAIRLRLVEKHHRGDVPSDDPYEEMRSHEPLMRCKLAAWVCALDNRMTVTPEDWRLAGWMWRNSCGVWMRLLEFGRQQAEAEEKQRRARLVADVEASEAARLRVSDRVVTYARRIAVKVHKAGEDFERVKRSDYRRNFGKEEKRYFDDSLAYAVSQGWVIIEDDGVWLAPGGAKPA